MPNSRCAVSVTNGYKTQKYIEVTKNEIKRTAIITMKKPPVNSLCLELLEELSTAIKDLEENNFRGMILTSKLPTVFSAGLDLSELINPDETQLRKFWSALQHLWKTLYITPLITIAAINGHAPAGGCLLSLSCDHSIMVNKEKYKIGLPAAKLGIHVPKWLCEMYGQAIGVRKADRATKLGESFSPREAFKINLVDEIVDSIDRLLPKAEKELDEWLKIPENSFYQTKCIYRQPLVKELTIYAQEELDQVVCVTSSEETQEILRIYFENLKSRKFWS